MNQVGYRRWFLVIVFLSMSIGWGDYGEHIFDFDDQSTFEYGSIEQTTSLKTVGTREFSLGHLPMFDRDIVTDALRFGGAELDQECQITQNVEVKVAAFFLLREESKTNSTGDVTHYSYLYPMSEDGGIPRTPPVDLSSIERLPSDDDQLVEYRARPSMIMFLEEFGEHANRTSDKEVDPFLKPSHFEIRLQIDTETRQLKQLTMTLQQPVNFYGVFSIREFHSTYLFDFDDQVKANVVQSVKHRLLGAALLVFRPQMSYRGEFAYFECDSQSTQQSFLYTSIDAIHQLKPDLP